MRIQSQRDTFALRIAASEFPWKPEDRPWAYGPNGLYNQGTEAYHAPLENGHRLRVWDDTDYSNPQETPGGQWKGGFDHGEDFPSDPNQPTRMHPAYTAVYDENSPLRAKAYPSKEHAMQAIEQRYRQTFPIGTNTGPHDSGVDYSNLNDFKDYL